MRFGVVTKISNFLLLVIPFFFSNKYVLPSELIFKSIPPSTKRKHSRCVCLANSRVGHKIKARKPVCCGAFKSFIIGIRNAAVLPEPVGAQATIELFYINKIKNINN